MIRREKEVIRAIYHREVTNFFKLIRLSEKLAQREINCSICGEIITLDNFRVVTRKSDKLLFCCNNELCIQNFTSYLKGDKV